jgi:serine/threonine-protein kinase
MEALIPIIAILMVFGPPAYWVKRRYDLKEKALESGHNDPESQRRIAGLEHERKLLKERVENLESIVTGVDFELNMRIAQLAAAQSQLGLAPGAEPPPVSPIERTMTSVRPSAQSLAAKAEALREVSAPVIEPGKVINNRYRVERLLGRGGMGAVYLADDEVLGEQVALKVISSQFSIDHASLVDRFRREASAARKVSHTNVVRIHDLGEAPGGLLFISMEYVEGKTLAELLEANGALGARDTATILGQICDGLAAAHDAGVVHRDLKPQNVLIGARETVKLIDFGLAKTSFMASMTATGIMLGTPYYMSPEQVRGKEVDARSDLYSLGALAYHAVTGRPPFQGDNPIAIGFAHCSEQPRPPRELAPSISAELDAMIVRALEKDPRDRPHSAAQFRAAL